MFSSDEIYSISNFLHLCKKTLDEHIPSCWIQGEISNISKPRSGHIYFSLKDDKCQVRCVFFRLSQNNLNLQLENGLAVLVHANTTIYAARGDFQIIIEQVEQMGLGNLQLAFEQLKNKLAQEGLFADEHKKTLPNYPYKIGVISSANGSVIQDIINVLKRRHPVAKVLLFDTPTQGEACNNGIIDTIKAADNKKCDVLIIARGGGSLEDLWCFNQESVVRAIFATKTPIISAIGHETDFTIADFVADIRAPTPSVAAELASPDRYQKIQEVNNYYQKITTTLEYYLNNKRIQLDYISSKIIQPQVLIRQKKQYLININININNILINKINLYKQYINSKKHQLDKLSPIANIEYKKQQKNHLNIVLNQQINKIQQQNNTKLQQINNSINISIKHSLFANRQKLLKLSKSLEILSPMQTINRGYSIIKDTNGKVINSVKGVSLGAKISITLADGSLYTQVNDVKNK